MNIKLEDLRREAYVDAIYAKMENDNVVGVFSDKFDALLISYGFIVYPIIGLDSYIFDYWLNFISCKENEVYKGS